MSFYQKKSLDKGTAQAWHAKRRAAERYNVNVTSDDLRLIAGMIQRGEATFLEKLTNSRTKFRVRIREKVFIVVYDRMRHTIASFLPPEEL